MEEPISERMGEFIAQLRREKDLTQKALADQLHLTDKAVSKWERGLACPDITLLPALAELLGVTVEELLTASRGSVPPESPPPPEPAGGRPLSPGSKISRRWRQWAAAGLTLAVIIGAMSCLICDWAINGRRTWSAIPLISMGLGWSVVLPVLLIRQGGWAGLTVLTALIFPYLTALDRLLPVDILPVAVPMAALGLAFLWACTIAWRQCFSKKRRAAAWMTFFAAVLHLAVSGWLARLLQEPPDVFETALSTVILLVIGAGLLLWERQSSAK